MARRKVEHEQVYLILPFTWCSCKQVHWLDRDAKDLDMFLGPGRPGRGANDEAKTASVKRCFECIRELKHDTLRIACRSTRTGTLATCTGRVLRTTSAGTYPSSAGHLGPMVMSFQPTATRRQRSSTGPTLRDDDTGTCCPEDTAGPCGIGSNTQG